MPNGEYMKEGMDLKRLFLRFMQNMWIAVAAAVIGTLLGGGIYLLVRAVTMPVEYRAVSKVYVQFIWDPSGQVEQHYNGYTWNDLMGAAPILDRTMAELAGSEISREEVVAATKAEILSDTRLLTLTFSTADEELTRRIQQATEAGIVAFGNNSDEITNIEVIKTQEPERITWDDKTLDAALWGGGVLLIIAVLVMLVYYVLDDSLYVLADAENRYPYPALGILTAEKGENGTKQPYGGELAENIAYLLADTGKVALVPMESGKEATDAARICRRIMASRGEGKGKELVPLEFVPLEPVAADSGVGQVVRTCDGAVLVVPWGRGNGRRLEWTISFLKNQDCKILGLLITEGNEKFLKCYYGCKGRKKVKVERK